MMSLVSGIAIIILVVAGVAVMFVIMQENADVADNVVDVANHNNERIKEDVDIVWNGQDLKMHNAGPEIDILEYRVLDDDGAILRICPVEQEVGSSKKEVVDTTPFDECWREFLT